MQGLGFFTFIGLFSLAYSEKPILLEDPKPPQVKQVKNEADLETKSKAYNLITTFAKANKLSKQAKVENWNQFFGPRGDGVSRETKLNLTWSNDGPKKLWELKTGTGYASPAILGKKLVYQHRIKNEVIIECLDAETGNKFWEFRYHSKYEDRYGYQNGPRSSPIISEDELVYTFGAEGELHCFLLKTGKILWQRNIHKEFPVANGFFGVGTTPLLAGDALYINIGAQKGPNVIKLNRLTGKLLWGSDQKWGASYATPVIGKLHGKTKLLVFAGGESRPPHGGLLCIDPDSGLIHSRFFWRSDSYESVNVASPIIIDNKVFISASYQTGGTLLSFDDKFQAKQLWHNMDLGTHFNTSIHIDGYLYGFTGRHSRNAKLSCIEIKTGKTMWMANPRWKEKVTVNGRTQNLNMGTLRGSMIHAENKFIVLGEFGHLLCMELSPKGHKILSQSWLFPAKDSWAPPVLSHGLLYISQHTNGYTDESRPRLICYDLRAP